MFMYIGLHEWHEAAGTSRRKNQFVNAYVGFVNSKVCLKFLFHLSSSS